MPGQARREGRMLRVRTVEMTGQEESKTQKQPAATLVLEPLAARGRALEEGADPVRLLDFQPQRWGNWVNSCKNIQKLLLGGRQQR
jgi:hypothetical protein